MGKREFHCESFGFLVAQERDIEKVREYSTSPMLYQKRKTQNKSKDIRTGLEII